MHRIVLFTIRPDTRYPAGYYIRCTPNKIYIYTYGEVVVVVLYWHYRAQYHRLLSETQKWSFEISCDRALDVLQQS